MIDGGFPTKVIDKYLEVGGVPNYDFKDTVFGQVIEGMDVADKIVKSILENNKKAPDAIFLIGGTSQMFGLREKIAEKIELPKERVSVRDLSLIKNVSIFN